MHKVAVIDYGMGNLHSVCKALEKVGGVPVLLSEPADPDAFDHAVLPGVGALGDCMRGLHHRGMADWVRSWIRENRPFLGVCLGLQALFERSEEYDAKGLNILPGVVRRFQLSQPYKIPHMGWNAVQFHRLDTVMDKGLLEGEPQFYFDHSFFVVPEEDSMAWGWTDHGHPFVSAVRSGNCYAVQFHPEKSQAIGLQIYENFLRLSRA
ncbi:MAG: imidazole glycerol phosphate synthase subunit HisH [Puniceicoccaceae bacterium]